MKIFLCFIWICSMIHHNILAYINSYISEIIVPSIYRNISMVFHNIIHSVACKFSDITRDMSSSFLDHYLTGSSGLSSEQPLCCVSWQHCCPCELWPVPRLAPLWSQRTLWQLHRFLTAWLGGAWPPGVPNSTAYLPVRDTVVFYQHIWQPN